MDGLSIAASIVGIATAGGQVSFKLGKLATQISTASDRVSAIGNDICLMSGVLRQLGDLMTQKTADAGISILSDEAIKTTKTAAAMCERIFSEIEKELKRASEQLRRYEPRLSKICAQKIELSKTEKAKWPFLQPKIDGLRTDLRDAKSTLMLLLELANLALLKKTACISASELQDSSRAVLALALERPENSQLRGSKIDRSPVAHPPGPNIPPTIENIRDRTVDPKSSRAPSEYGDQTQRTHNSELQLFLLKPLVKDLYDKIELRWTVQNTNMQSPAICEYMDKNEKDGLPPVVEMLQQLNAYEQEMVESETPKDSGKSILSLKRTTTDIQTRDMLFKAVPGLQFVVRRHVGLSLHQGEGSFRQTMHRVSERLDLLRPQAKASKSSFYSFGSSSRTSAIEHELDGRHADISEALLSTRRPRASPRGSMMLKTIGDKGEEEQINTEQREAGEDDKAEAEAEAMVNGLLKQYTTIFDS